MHRRKYPWLLWAILAFAFTTRLLVIRMLPMPPYAGWTSDPHYYSQIAHNIVQRGEYTELYLKAYRPPLFPVFLSLNIWGFGEHTQPLQVVQNLLFLGAVALFALAILDALGVACALTAALLLLVNPMWLVLPQQGLSEPLFVLFLSLALLLGLRACRTGGMTLPLLSGVALGLAALTREIGALYALAIVPTIAFARRDGEGHRTAWKPASLCALGVVLTVLPWSIRNYVVFEQLVPISTNGPINLYIGNNPTANGRFEWRLPPDAQAIWNDGPSEHGSHEILAIRLAQRAALRYIFSHPGRTLSLAAGKAWLLWCPWSPGHGRSAADLLKDYRYASWIPYLLAGCYGLWLLRREPLARMILGILIVGTIVHSITVSELRYRAPYEFVLAAPAAYGLLTLLNRLVGKDMLGTGRWGLKPPETRSTVMAASEAGRG